MRSAFFVGAIFLSFGFFFKMTLPDKDAPKVPPSMPHNSIEENVFYKRLVGSYGKGFAHERVKIQYLFGEIRNSPFTFIRNGLEYDAGKTAKHLNKKYQKRVRELRTARQFIEEIATKSSMSGKPYLTKDEEGNLYYSSDILHYELDRLEQFLKTTAQAKTSQVV